MIKGSENKMISGDEKGLVIEKQFFFPEHGVNVTAKDTQEAEEKLSKIISDKNLNKDHE